MKIGIFINEFGELSNPELRVIEAILNNPENNLIVLKIEGSTTIKTTVPLGYFLSNFLLRIHLTLEKKLFFKESYTVNKEQIINNLKDCPIIKLSSSSKNTTFLDIALKLVPDKKIDENFRIAKHGILSLEQNEVFIDQKGFSGFWEILDKEPVVTVKLIQKLIENNAGQVIDTAYFNKHWSISETNSLVKEGAVSLLLKYIDKLKKEEEIGNKEISVTFSAKIPNIYSSAKYIFRFYFYLTKKIIEKLSSKFLGKRYHCWTLFIGKGKFLESDLTKLEPIEMPKDEFWADPFLYNYKGDDFVFFEKYPYKTKKGIISCGKIKNGTIIDIVDILDFEYHLSYPNIFEENGDIFLMPETAQNQRLEIYKCVDFPKKWELYTTALEGERVTDATFHTDEKGEKWLFVNKKKSPIAPSDCELHIYKIDSLKLNNMEPHTQNPVIIDSRSARNAGPIFKNDNYFVRPSQSCIHGIYGKFLNINKIEKLDLNEYVEKNIRVVEPTFFKGLCAVHHLHQTHDMFMFDAAYIKK